MDTTCKFRLSQFWSHLQHELFPFLREEDHLELSPALEKVIRVLEFTEIDRFIPPSRGFVGRPPKDRVALARAFIAKPVLDLPTTEALIDSLKADRTLRRICGFERFHFIPDASRFSRAFAEFAALELPARVHEALIRAQLGDQLVGSSCGSPPNAPTSPIAARSWSMPPSMSTRATTSNGCSGRPGSAAGSWTAPSKTSPPTGPPASWPSSRRPRREYPYGAPHMAAPPAGRPAKPTGR